MKPVIRQAALLVAMAAVGAILTWAIHPRAPALYLRNEPLTLNEVTLEHIETEWNGDVIWVDARSRSEYEKEHQPGAMLLNEEEWTALLEENIEVFFDADKPIVVYCGAQACEASRKVAERLRQNTPLENVFFLRGGWKVLRKRQ